MPPFPPSLSVPGQGLIHLHHLPPGTQSLSHLTYTYPLKLISPSPHTLSPSSTSNNAPSPPSPPWQITTIFLLSYGGGLVGGDCLNLDIHLHSSTRLILLTQGSTKIFKSPSRDVITRQTLNVRVADGAGLCYLPDPSQPFAESVFEQGQVFEIARGGSVCVLDWVLEGRRARGESWGFWGWKGRNEIREPVAGAAAAGKGGEKERFGKGRLVLRDLVVLSDQHGFGNGGNGLLEKTDGMAVFGTLILCGEVFKWLGEFAMDVFGKLPRIGAKDWNESSSKDITKEKDKKREWHRDGLLWTAARVRGCVIVKFGAKELDVAKGWLLDLISAEGRIEKEFGHQALFCLR